MTIVSDEWLYVSENYCEHYGVDKDHYGDIKRLKKSVPDEIRKIYSEKMKEWKAN